MQNMRQKVDRESSLGNTIYGTEGKEAGLDKGKSQAVMKSQGKHQPTPQEAPKLRRDGISDFS